MKRRLFVSAAACATAAPAVWAQADNSAATRIVVPFAAGAGSDAMARFFAQELGKSMQRTFIVENKVGAAGAIGADFVAKAAPDGNTLLFIASPFTTVAAGNPQPRYDPLAFAPVAIMGIGPLMFVAHPSVPGKDLNEVIAYAKQNPGKLNYGSAGAGGINHLVMELLKQETGTFMVHIPYRGIAPATVDLIGNQLQVLTGSVPALLPYIKDGRVKALAVTSRKRISVAPDVPGMEELGFKGFDVNNYWGFVAPPKTPVIITQKLNDEINKLLATPAVIARLRQDATEPSPMPLASINAMLVADLNKWKQLVATAKLQLDA